MTERKFRLNQETIAMAVGTTIVVATILCGTHRLGNRIDRVASELVAEMRADREVALEGTLAELQSHRESLLESFARVERDARADRERFIREIRRLTGNPAYLAEAVDAAGGSPIPHESPR